MSAASVLFGALQRIESADRWVKQAIAVDANGNEVKVTSERAKRFCMIGAIQLQKSDAHEYGEAIRHLRTACGGSIFEFNDTHGHKAVKAVMRKAIEIAGAAA